MNRLEEIYDKAKKDPRLEHFRLNKAKFVPGSGNINPKVVFVGEAPGRVENARSTPFVGPAGQELKRLMAHALIDPDDVFYTNVLKYWPHVEYSTRTPSMNEIKVSSEYLMSELDYLADDDTIVALCGRVALMAIFPDQTSINHIHGTRMFMDGISFVPVYHPAVLLYGSQPFDKVAADYKLIGELAYAGTH
jgi:uracil-DNA glycosylase family 4